MKTNHSLFVNLYNQLHLGSKDPSFLRYVYNNLGGRWITWYNRIWVTRRLWSLQCSALHFTSPLWRDMGKHPPPPKWKTPPWHQVIRAAQQRMRASGETRLTRLWWNNFPYHLIWFVLLFLFLFVCLFPWFWLLSFLRRYVHLLFPNASPSSQLSGAFWWSAMLLFSSAFLFFPPIYTQVVFFCFFAFFFFNFPCWSFSFDDDDYFFFFFF